METVVGILGGMGPEATSDLFKKIIDLTDADGDQDHIRIIIENNVKISDRTAYILKNGVSPLKQLIKSAIRLELMGANLICMPCNTAHYFYDDIVEYIDVPFINMIHEVGKLINHSHPSGSSIGLLATTGTYEGNIYENYLNEYNIKIVRPSPENRKLLLDMIYSVKKGKKDVDLDIIRRILKEFMDQNITTLILGCTELPLVFNNLNISETHAFNFIDSTAVLAGRVVELSKEKK